MTQDTPTVEEIVEEFNRAHAQYMYPQDARDARKFLRTALTKVAEESRQLGRNEILEEWNHDQRKLLDGFNHPKDCKLCEQYGDHLQSDK